MSRPPSASRRGGSGRLRAAPAAALLALAALLLALARARAGRARRARGRAAARPGGSGRRPRASPGRWARAARRRRGAAAIALAAAPSRCTAISPSTRWRQMTTPAAQATNCAATPPASPRSTASNAGTPARSESTVTTIRPTRPARPRQRRMLVRARGCATTATFAVRRLGRLALVGLLAPSQPPFAIRSSARWRSVMKRVRRFWSTRETSAMWTPFSSRPPSRTIVPATTSGPPSSSSVQLDAHGGAELQAERVLDAACRSRTGSASSSRRSRAARPRSR